MSAQDANSYSGEKLKLRDAWREGYQAGQRNEEIPKDRIHDRVMTNLAWMEGCVEAQLELSEEI